MATRFAIVDPHRVSRTAPLIELLRARIDLVAPAVIPGVSRRFDVMNKALAFHPRRDTWRARAYFNARRWDIRTSDAAEQLAALPAHDVRLHVYPISCALPNDRPYVVLTDNTMAVTQRSFKRWADLPAAAASAAQAREAEVLRRAAFVVAYSTQARNSALEDYGCEPERVLRTDGGVLFAAPVPVERPPGRNVLFVATSFWRKGGATLLTAWQQVEGRFPDARLTIAGPSHRPPRDLPATANWLGPQNAGQLTELYRHANVFVLPTLFESSVPNVLREAMAFNLPVVASDVPGIALDAPDQVVLSAPNDSDGLAAALSRLLNDPAAAAERGLRLREVALERYSFEHLADVVSELLERAVAERVTP